MFTITDHLEARPSFHAELQKLVDLAVVTEEDRVLNLALAFLEHGDVEFYHAHGFSSEHEMGFCTYCGERFERDVSCEVYCKPCYREIAASMSAAAITRDDLPF